MPTNRTTLLYASLLLGLHATGQITITLQQAVDSALKTNPRARAADLAVRSAEQAEGASFSLPDLQVYTENPSGDFYTMGVTQPIDYPGVYFKQGKQAKAVTALAGKQRAVSSLDLKREVHRLYREAQMLQAQVGLLIVQDSALQQISTAAERQFDAGQIDKMQQLFAATQYGQAHARYQSAVAAREAALAQLSLLIGARSAVSTEAYGTQRTAPAVIAAAATPLLATAEARRDLDEATWRLERNRARPGLTVGFLNQGPEGTPVNAGWRLGVTLPIWFWQYDARIKSARTNMERAELETGALALEIQRASIAANAEARAAWQELQYYTTTGVAEADSLADAARRFLEQGRMDHVNYLRTLRDVYDLKLAHLAALLRYDQAMIELNYLNGTL